MKGHEVEHVEERLQAWLDGELDESESAAVKRHVESCGRCAGALSELRALREAIADDAESQPLRPMWPAVRAAAYPVSRTRFGLSFGLATSLAAAAGLVIGISLGSLGETPVVGVETESEYAASMLGSDEILSLDEMYVAAFEEDGESE
jgi:anti-sigma factor RsiW